MKSPINEEDVIRCKGLAIGYDNEPVISDINLCIRSGDYLPFIGPNGAGKTTLLRTFLGLIEPVSGELSYPGQRKPPGYVPQISTLEKLYPVSAREVINMGFYPLIGFWGSITKEMDLEVDKLVERFHLSEHINRPIEELSGGMRQKVLIARALVSGADILIMDEPASNLDEESEMDLVKLLYDISKVERKTVLFAQHGIAPVLNFATRVCYFSQGKVELIPMTELSKRTHFPAIRKDV